MNEAASMEKPATQPPATRMWAVIQKLSRARDEFGRSKTHAAKQALADEVSSLVNQLRNLADAMLIETRDNGN